MGMTQQFFVLFVPGDRDLWPWHSNSSERGTKHVFTVNLTQIRSSIPEIFEWQQKTKNNNKTKSQTALKTEPYSRAVINKSINKYSTSASATHGATIIIIIIIMIIQRQHVEYWLSRVAACIGGLNAVHAALSPTTQHRQQRRISLTILFLIMQASLSSASSTDLIYRLCW